MAVKKHVLMMTGLMLAGGVMAAAPKGTVMELKVVQASVGPVLDGKLDDRAWLEAGLYGSKASGFVDATGAKLAEYQPVVLAAYDQENLYVAVKSFVPDSDKLVANSKPGEFSWGDDLIQMFFEPALDGWYVHYGINSKGVTTLDAVKAATAIAKTYWVLEIAVPWKVLQVTPQEGMLMGFNIAGCQVAAGGGWITWMPTYGGFHNPERFGYLALGSVLPVKKLPVKVEEDDF
ncbi:MAG: sugar-binding protein [Kiritimatiellia bacterium]|nr:sugar-binding protein [Kiritimatiellia bacterium]